MAPMSEQLKLSLTKLRAVWDPEMPVFTNHQTHITVKTLLETQEGGLYRLMVILAFFLQNY
jgi:hypothetical protein